MNYTQESIQIIANICSLSITDIQEAYKKQDYRIFSVPKRSGGKRMIHAPEGLTKLVQQRLYEKFFIKLSYHRVIPKNIFGGLKKTSIIDHANVHTGKPSKFLVKMDLKNAFHCVSENPLSKAIYDLFCQEVSIVRYLKYPDKEKIFYDFDLNAKWSRSFSYENEEALTKRTISSFDKDFDLIKGYLGKRFGNYTPVLFRKKDNSNLWYLIRDGRDDKKLKKLFVEISKIISRIVTYKSVMVQGSTTSPILMALMVAHTDLLKTFSDDFSSDKVSIYVDDLAISTNLKSKEKIEQKISSLIKKIEKSTVWKFNSKKTRIYDLDKEHPILTGLRLKTIEKLIDDKITKVLEVTLPKKLQGVIRSSIHRAQYANDIDATMIAEGYIAYVISVFGNIEKMPGIIKTQLYKYFDTKDLSFLNKNYEKTKATKPSVIEIRSSLEKHSMLPSELTAQDLW